MGVDERRSCVAVAMHVIRVVHDHVLVSKTEIHTMSKTYCILMWNIIYTILANI